MAKTSGFTPKTPAGGPADGPEPLPDIPGFEVDTEMLRKYGTRLLEPAARMGLAADNIGTNESTLTQNGEPPWGSGEIGDFFGKWYANNATPLIESVRDMQEGLNNTAERFGVSSETYVRAEDANLGG